MARAEYRRRLDPPAVVDAVAVDRSPEDVPEMSALVSVRLARPP